MNETLQRRVEAAKFAVECVDSLSTESEKDAFIKAVLRLMPKPPEAPQKKQPNYSEIVLPFGSHQGEMLKDAPLDYLDWLCSAQEEFLEKLQVYLKSPSASDRRRQEQHE